MTWKTAPVATTVTRVRGLTRRAERSLRAARSAWSGTDVEAGAAHGFELEMPPWPQEGPGPTFPGLISQACTDAQLRTAAYRAWGDRLRVPQIYVHRKQWEWFYIAQALEESGVVRPGARGLGFGVGNEPLPSWMAPLSPKLRMSCPVWDQARRDSFRRR